MRKIFDLDSAEPPAAKNAAGSHTKLCQATKDVSWFFCTSAKARLKVQPSSSPMSRAPIFQGEDGPQETAPKAAHKEH